jgi:hypothetical protein
MKPETFSEAVLVAISNQISRGKKLIQPISLGTPLEPYSLLRTSSKKLWEESNVNSLHSEAARYHFMTITYASFKGLADQRNNPQELEVEVPEVLDALRDWYRTYGAEGVEKYQHLGCVIAVMNGQSRLSNLKNPFSPYVPKSTEAKQAWLDVIVGSITAEMLYINQWGKPLSARYKELVGV